MHIPNLQDRRTRLAEVLEPNEMVIIFGAPEPAYPRRFLQEHNLLYFTGVEAPDAVFVAYKAANTLTTALYLERQDPAMVVWEGAKLSPDDAREISGIQRVGYLDQLREQISGWMRMAETCYVNKAESNLEQPLNKEQQFMQRARNHFPAIQFKNLRPLMVQLRARKDQWEVEQLQTAIDATGKGIMRIFKDARSGMHEYELEAMLRCEAMSSGLPHMGFFPIIASGLNAATLHYHANNCQIGENDMVLLDVGAGCNNYSADITRTFPVSGTFTPRQREVYQAVLDVNKAIIDMVMPGVTMTKLNKETVKLITAALKKLGLIEKDEEYRKYYMHSVGHHLGMDTHDVGPREEPLEPGHVITVEPGIYIPEEAIGVRIEDDILVTEDGAVNLSVKIPKEIDQLEELCKRA